jgi:hypothetical protein
MLARAEVYANHKNELVDALKDTPHSLLWFDLGDCDTRRKGDGGLALAMFVSDDGGAYVVLVQADQSSVSYPLRSPRQTSFPPDPDLIPYYFEDWTTACRVSSLLLTLSANVVQSETLHRLFPLDPGTPQFEVPRGYEEYTQVFFGPLISKLDDFYGYGYLGYSHEKSQGVLMVSGAGGWSLVTTRRPEDLVSLISPAVGSETTESEEILNSISTETDREDRSSVLPTSP